MMICSSSDHEIDQAITSSRAHKIRHLSARPPFVARHRILLLPGNRPQGLDRASPCDRRGIALEGRTQVLIRRRQLAAAEFDEPRAQLRLGRARLPAMIADEPAIDDERGVVVPVRRQPVGERTAWRPGAAGPVRRWRSRPARRFPCRRGAMAASIALGAGRHLGRRRSTRAAWRWWSHDRSPTHRRVRPRTRRCARRAPRRRPPARR